MRKKFAVILLLTGLLFSSCALAGWDSQTTGTAQQLNAIYLVSDSAIYSVGANGALLYTTDGGAVWTDVSSGSATYNDVLFVGSYEGYALGSSGSVRKWNTVTNVFAPQSMPPAVAAANFKNGSASGVDRAFAASMGDSAAGYLVESHNSGNSFTATLQTDFAIDGVLLANSSTWMWGKYLSGSYSGQYVIVKDGTVVWNGSTRLNDVFFYNSTTGYAVGNSGLVLKTTDGGTAWSTVTSGLTANLNALYFITASFGWIVGDSGTIAFTSDGGSSWSSYTGISEDIKDIYVMRVVTGSSAKAATVKAQAFTQVYAYICGSGGKIYKLTSPTFSSITPSSKKQGWTGTYEVTGTGFVSGATVTFDQTGASGGITALTASVDSATSITGTLMISPETTTGTWSVTVTNPDATATQAAGAFTVATNEAVVEISNVWFDGSAYVTYESTASVNRVTVRPETTVSFEVSSVRGITPGTARVSLVGVGSSTITQVIPASAFTALTATSAAVSYTLPSTNALPAGDVTITLIGRDDLENTDNYVAIVRVAGGPVDPTKSPAGNSKPGYGYVGVLPSTQNGRFIDPESGGNTPAIVMLPEGQIINANVTFTVFDFHGRIVYKGIETVPTGGFVNKINHIMSQINWAQYLSAGAYVLVVTRNDTNAIIAKNVILVGPGNQFQ